MSQKCPLAVSSNRSGLKNIRQVLFILIANINLHQDCNACTQCGANENEESVVSNLFLDLIPS